MHEMEFAYLQTLRTLSSRIYNIIVFDYVPYPRAYII